MLACMLMLFTPYAAWDCAIEYLLTQLHILCMMTGTVPGDIPHQMLTPVYVGMSYL